MNRPDPVLLALQRRWAGRYQQQWRCHCTADHDAIPLEALYQSSQHFDNLVAGHDTALWFTRGDSPPLLVLSRDSQWLTLSYYNRAEDRRFELADPDCVAGLERALVYRRAPLLLPE